MPPPSYAAAAPSVDDVSEAHISSNCGSRNASESRESSSWSGCGDMCALKSTPYCTCRSRMHFLKNTSAYFFTKAQWFSSPVSPGCSNPSLRGVGDGCDDDDDDDDGDDDLSHFSC